MGTIHSVLALEQIAVELRGWLFFFPAEMEFMQMCFALNSLTITSWCGFHIFVRDLHKH